LHCLLVTAQLFKDEFATIFPRRRGVKYGGQFAHQYAFPAAFAAQNCNGFREEWKIIRSRIKIIDSSHIPRDIFDKSFEIVKDIDEWDVYFVALHFQTGHKIWTGDKILINGLKEKGYNICVTTDDLKSKLYKKD